MHKLELLAFNYADTVSNKHLNSSFVDYEQVHVLTGGDILIYKELVIFFIAPVMIPFFFTDKCSCEGNKKCNLELPLRVYNN